ncbi:MAG: enoyl-CoA hydratase/isomerase family protein [Bacteroidia bacterium]|nr:enoyl-CoA hydratase/isomerase family protein [Bacteroidia bacterium]
MSRETAETHIENGIARITFFHPQSNSLPGELLRKLASEIEQASNNDTVKVIILQSRGEKAFCAGASFDELVSIKNKEEGLQFFSGFASVINAMRKAQVFVIARIQGKCVGGGVGLAAAADYAIAHESASVKLSELAVGIGPFVVGPAVERKMGKAAFTAMTIDASSWRSAEWAYQNGLFAELHNSFESLEEAVNKLAFTLAACNPEAMAMLKKVFWEGTNHWDELLKERAGISGHLVLSDFTRNAIAKFKSK